MKNEEYREEKKKSKFRSISRAELLTKNTQLITNLLWIIRILSKRNMLLQNFHLRLSMKMKLSASGLITNCGKIFISSDYNKNTPFIFATTLEDHSENTMFLKSARRYGCWRKLIENYEIGNVRFENQKIKNISEKLIKSLLLI